MSVTKVINVSHQMGLLGTISYVVGGVIGTGIFISPVVVLKQTHSPGLTLSVWLATGAIAIIGSCVSAELASSIPVSGGGYAYLMHVGWDPVAFAGIWLITFVAKTSSAAAACETFANYLIAAIGINLESETNEQLVKLIAYIFVWAIVFMNFLPLDRFASVLQIASTVCKLIGLLAVIGIGIWYIIIGKTEYLQQPFDHSNWDPVAIGLGIYGTLYSYTGWDSVCAGLEEVKNPKRNAPLALVLGMLIVTGVYVLTNMSYLVVLGPVGMLQSSAVAQSLGEESIYFMGLVIPFVVCISIIGSLNCSCFEHSRMLFSGAREKHFPSLFSVLHINYGTPIPSVLFMGVLVSILVTVGSVETLILIRIFIGNIWVLCITAALIYIKVRKVKISDGAVKFPLVIPIVYLLIMLPITVVPIIKYPVMCGVGTAAIVFFMVIYYFLVRTEANSTISSKLNESTTEFCQKLFMCIPEINNIQAKIGSSEKSAAEQKELN